MTQSEDIIAATRTGKIEEDQIGGGEDKQKINFTFHRRSLSSLCGSEQDWHA
jgi:hypothetical protein